MVLLPLGITLLSNRIDFRYVEDDSFTTTWDYTTLKRVKFSHMPGLSFTTTWDYTTLKPQISKRQVFRSEKWENSPFSYGLEQHSDTTTEYPAAAKRL